MKLVIRAVFCGFLLSALLLGFSQVVLAEDNMQGYNFSNPELEGKVPEGVKVKPYTGDKTSSDPAKSGIKNVEKVPGFEQTNNLVRYLEQWYRFGIGIVAILAVVMIAVGAFQYIVGSAGNSSVATDGKDRIYSAIYGLVLAMLVYLIFFLINPDILKGSIQGSSYQPGYGSGAAGPGGSAGGTSNGYKQACPNPKENPVIDYSKAKDDPKIKYAKDRCDQYNKDFNDAANKYGIEACVLKAVAMKESSCGLNKGPSSHNACGIMQMKPTTAGAGISCDDLMKRNDLAIDLAAKFIKENQAKAESAENQLSGIFAGYNSGYNPYSSEGKLASLAPSRDCKGSLAFECCINPGGLDESINYAWNAMGYYNQCKNN